MTEFLQLPVQADLEAALWFGLGLIVGLVLTGSIAALAMKCLTRPRSHVL